MTDKEVDLDAVSGQRSVRPGDADLVRRMAAEERVTSSPSTTASADSVEALRRLVRDLKHDVRMLKVVVDKQSALLERLTMQLDRG